MSRHTPDWLAHLALYVGTGAAMFALVYLLAWGCFGGMG